MPYPGERNPDKSQPTSSWQPSTENADKFNYLGANSGYTSLEDAQAADNASGRGTWVPATDKAPVSPWKIIGSMALAGGGGQAIADYGIPALTSLFSGGGAGAGGAGAASTATGAAAPAVGGTTAAAAPSLMAAGDPAFAMGAGAKGMGLLSGLTGNNLINTGVGLAQGFMQGKQNDKQLAQQNAQFLASQAQNQRQFDAAQGQTQANQALNVAQSNPFAQQQDRQAQALVAQIMANYAPVKYENGHYTGGLNNLTDVFKNSASFFGPDAMAAAEQSYTANAMPATGGKYVAPSLGSVGYQGAAANTPRPVTPSSGTLSSRAPLNTAGTAGPMTGGSDAGVTPGFSPSPSSASTTASNDPLSSMLGMQQQTSAPANYGQSSNVPAGLMMAPSPGAMPDAMTVNPAGAGGYMSPATGMPSTSAQGPDQLAQVGQAPATPANPTDQPNLMALIAKLTGKSV